MGCTFSHNNCRDYYRIEYLKNYLRQKAEKLHTLSAPTRGVSQVDALAKVTKWSHLSLILLT